MIDILKKISDGELTVDQAYDIMDTIVDRYHDGELVGEIPQTLCLDNYEWTAICHALDLGVLADWRKHGWPNLCCQCGSKIDYKEYGWTIKNDKIKGLNCC